VTQQRDRGGTRARRAGCSPKDVEQTAQVGGTRLVLADHGSGAAADITQAGELPARVVVEGVGSDRGRRRRNGILAQSIPERAGQRRRLAQVARLPGIGDDVVGLDTSHSDRPPLRPA
jgi:hypothetical protein